MKSGVGGGRIDEHLQILQKNHYLGKHKGWAQGCVRAWYELLRTGSKWRLSSVGSWRDSSSKIAAGWKVYRKSFTSLNMYRENVTLNEHITAAEYREYLRTGKLPGSPKKSKYKNNRTERDGKVYASKREAERHTELKLLQQARAIALFFEQVPFHLPGGLVYIPDFVVLHLDGSYIVEDAKGFQTDVYKIKKKLMKETFQIEVREV